MHEQMKFDPAQADKLVKKIENKIRTIKATLNKIERLVEDCAKRNWEGESRIVYIHIYKCRCEQILNYLKKWLEEIMKFMNEAKEAKRLQEEAGSEMIRGAQNAIATPQ